MTEIKIMPEDPADAKAIQAVASGTASDGQQKRAIRAILDLAMTYDRTFDPESQHVTAFNEGRRHVGRAIVGCINMNITEFNQTSKDKESKNERRKRTTR